MIKIKFIQYALVVSLFFPNLGLAAQEEMKEHKVVKGDTLWDLSGKELKDPFLWPKIWEVNKWIADPHWIYPGQIIKIPVYLLKKEEEKKETPPQEVAPDQRDKKPAEPPKEQKMIIKQPLVNKNIIMASGFISNDVQRAGEIIDSPSGEVLFGNLDTVYVNLDQPAKDGDKFYVVKVSGPIDHPITGRQVGYIIKISGVIKMAKNYAGDNVAKITKCFREINVNDILIPYFEMDVPITDGKFRYPDLNGLILAATSDAIYNTMFDVVYLDRGCKDGIEVGDKFRTYDVGKRAVQNGEIQVISCRDHDSTAIIVSSSSPIFPGNIYSNMDRR